MFVVERAKMSQSKKPSRIRTTKYKKNSNVFAGTSNADRLRSLTAAALGQSVQFISDEPDSTHNAPEKYRGRKTNRCPASGN